MIVCDEDAIATAEERIVCHAGVIATPDNAIANRTQCFACAAAPFALGALPVAIPNDRIAATEKGIALYKEGAVFTARFLYIIVYKKITA